MTNTGKPAAGKPGWAGTLIGVACMAMVVALSNYLVQFPVSPDQIPAWIAASSERFFGLTINELLTWGAFTYPIAFLVNDLTNRKFGKSSAQLVVVAGFVIAVLLSIWLASPRIALASGAAFLIAQLLDVRIFDALRHTAWWRAPVLSSACASAIDTLLFFSIAFIGTGLPWTTWALGDYAVKLLVALAMLIPFRLLIGSIRTAKLAEQ